MANLRALPDTVARMKRFVLRSSVVGSCFFFAAFRRSSLGLIADDAYLGYEFLAELFGFNVLGNRFWSICDWGQIRFTTEEHKVR